MRVITRHRSITLKHVCFDLKFIKSYKSLQYNGLKNLFSPVVAFQMYHLSISLATMEKGNSHSWQAVNRSSSNLLHAGWYKSTSTGTVQCFTGSNASLVPLNIIEKTSRKWWILAQKSHSAIFTTNEIGVLSSRLQSAVPGMRDGQRIPIWKKKSHPSELFNEVAKSEITWYYN